MRGQILLLKVVLYLIGCRAALGVRHAWWRGVALAAVNVIAYMAVVYVRQPLDVMVPGALAYLAGAGVHFYLVRRIAGGANGWFVAAAVFPITVFATVRYLPLPAAAGVSYLALRLSHLAFEVRNQVVQVPSVGEYLAFAFYAPLASVGPIQPYSRFMQGVRAPLGWRVSLREPVVRVAVGLTKYLFLASLAQKVAFNGLLLDGNQHHVVDVPIAMLAYYVYLYCNFSGFCDVMVGMAAFAGVPIDENFDHPFRARNVKDFWNRWHISLSVYMRDMVFTPLSKSLIRTFGPRAAQHCVALAVFVVFLLVGVFHGVGWNFFWFGALHGIGVVINQYYDLWLKSLGRERYRAYHDSRSITLVAQAATVAFVSASFLLFANSMDQIRQIMAAIR